MTRAWLAVALFMAAVPGPVLAQDPPSLADLANKVAPRTVEPNAGVRVYTNADLKVRPAPVPPVTPPFPDIAPPSTLEYRADAHIDAIQPAVQTEQIGNWSLFPGPWLVTGPWLVPGPAPVVDPWSQVPDRRIVAPTPGGPRRGHFERDRSDGRDPFAAGHMFDAFDQFSVPGAGTDSRGGHDGLRGHQSPRPMRTPPPAPPHQPTVAMPPAAAGARVRQEG